MDLKKWIAALSVLLLVASAQAQHRMASYNNYIKQYSQAAVEQMRRHNIPASITLAQGLLESAAGTSRLTLESNNHFGIKCGMRWNGPSVRHDDDAANECFRAYRNAAESYEDHSRFLLSNSRYDFLFQLNKSDYRGWANGLKKAGYATDKSYANKLIGIIETYNLYKFDNEGLSKHEQKKWDKLLKKKPWLAYPHEVFIANGLAYVVARSGDTFKFLAGEFGVKWKDLVKYNDLHKEYTLEEGDIVYLAKKNKRTVSADVFYSVREGDSMQSISQKYGIRLKNLYRLNKMDGDHIPEVGERIWLK